MKKFKTFNTIVNHTYSKKIKVFIYKIYILLQMIYIFIIQSLNKMVKKIGPNKYELTYCLGGKIYKLILTPKKGPNPFILAFDENNNDITYKIIQLMGPQKDFHGQDYYVKNFKCKTISFSLITGEEKTFQENDKIILT